MKIKVYGKINLALNVLGIQDGFHTLDMVTSPVSAYDEVAIFPCVKMKCNQTDLCPMEKNTAYAAGKLFSETFKTPYVSIEITKGIPVMAGLGGSSADAAAVIFAMAKMFGVTDEKAVLAVARKVGSDVPLMLKGGFNRVMGTGEVITSIDSNLEFHILTAKKQGGVSAKQCYSKFDTMKGIKSADVEKLIYALNENNYPMAVDNFANMLEAPAVSLEPNIFETLEFLESQGADKTIMYGSGSACGGIFKDKQKALEIEKKFKDSFPYLKLLKTVKNSIEIIEG